MPKKRILVFNDCFVMGGTEVLLVNLLNHLITKDCHITLLLPNPSDKNTLLERVSPDVPVKYIYQQELKGLKKWVYKNISIFYPNVFAKLVGFNQNEYDEIVCFKDGFYSILFSRTQLPKYLWIQNQPFPRNFTSHSIKDKLAFALNKLQIKRMNASFDKFDRIICVSDSCKKSYIDVYHGGTPRREIDVLYNALDISSIAKRAEEPIDLPAPSCLSFITVIRLSHEKTVDRLILTADKLRNEGYKFEIHILGDGAEFKKLRSMITEYNLDDYITMHGRISNPFPYMKRADWFVCPSSRESFALTLIETASLGTPVITTECGGPVDVIAGGKYGILTPNSLEGVYSAMKKVLDDPTLLPYFISKTDENMSRFNYQEWLSAVDKLLDV